MEVAVLNVQKLQKDLKVKKNFLNILIRYIQEKL